MQIGIFYDNVKEAYPHIKDDSVLLEKIRELGFSYTELDCEELFGKDNSFFEKANKLPVGFSVYAFADENCVLKCGKSAEEYLPLLAARGIRKLMMVCREKNGRKSPEINDAIIGSLNHLCGVASKYGITILAEDFDSNDIPCGNSDDMLFFAEHVPALRFTFDTGNFAFFGENAADCIEKLKMRISHVHLKDRVSISDLTVTPTGEGGLNIEELIGLLKSNGYDGTMSVEMFGAATDPESLKNAIEFVKRSAGI